MREYHVRFCERLGLKCPCLLDYAAQASGLSTRDNIEFAISQHISTLVLMSVKYKFRNQEQLYFVTFAVVNWIDLFIRNEYKDIMLDSWKHCCAQKRT